jgi:hypothetical protein
MIKKADIPPESKQFDLRRMGYAAIHHFSPIFWPRGPGFPAQVNLLW